MKKFFDRAEWFLENIVLSLGILLFSFIGWIVNDVQSDNAWIEFVGSFLKQIWTRKVDSE